MWQQPESSRAKVIRDLLSTPLCPPPVLCEIGVGIYSSLQIVFILCGRAHFSLLHKAVVRHIAIRIANDGIAAINKGSVFVENSPQFETANGIYRTIQVVIELELHFVVIRADYFDQNVCTVGFVQNILCKPLCRSENGLKQKDEMREKNDFML